MSRAEIIDCVERHLRNKTKTEPCEDAISRKAVLDEMGDINMDVYTDEVKEFVKSLPSVQPKAKTGKWLVYKDCEGKMRQCTCDQCGHKTSRYTWENPNFCENCGARMESEG